MKTILLFSIILTLAITINSVEAKATCPEDTTWDGNNCIQNNTDIPITFTDYSGNPVVKSKEKIEPVEDIIITAPKHEILRDLMIIEPEIREIDDLKGTALEQKIANDRMDATNITRNNYHFEKIVQWTTKNAVAEFNKILFGKHVQNSDFGKNNNPQIEYTKRYERSEDPVLQHDILQENQRAQKIFLINWGNFTNY